LKNLDVRQAAKANGVPLWRIAEGLGVVDATLSRWLRHELSAEKKAKAMEVIERQSQGGKYHEQ
jgi:hypothetical protein